MRAVGRDARTAPVSSGVPRFAEEDDPRDVVHVVEDHPSQKAHTETRTRE